MSVRHNLKREGSNINSETIKVGDIVYVLRFGHHIYGKVADFGHTSGVHRVIPYRISSGDIWDDEIIRRIFSVGWLTVQEQEGDTIRIVTPIESVLYG